MGLSASHDPSNPRIKGSSPLGPGERVVSQRILQELLYPHLSSSDRASATALMQSIRYTHYEDKFPFELLGFVDPGEFKNFMDFMNETQRTLAVASCRSYGAVPLFPNMKTIREARAQALASSELAMRQFSERHQPRVRVAFGRGYLSIDFMFSPIAGGPPPPSPMYPAQQQPGGEVAAAGLQKAAPTTSGGYIIVDVDIESQLQQQQQQQPQQPLLQYQQAPSAPRQSQIPLAQASHNPAVQAEAQRLGIRMEAPVAPPRKAPPRRVDAASMARVLSDYHASSAGEMSLIKGELVIVEQKDPSGWWKVSSEDRMRNGWAPADWLEMQGV